MTALAREPQEAARRPVFPRPADPSSAARWPGLATPPSAPLRGRLAEALVRHGVAPLPVRLVFPDGRVWGAGDRSSPVPTSGWARAG